MKKLLIIITTILLVTCGCALTGSTMQINLKGNPTTGYSWESKIKDKSVIKKVENKYVPDKTDKNIVGSGGTYKYTFKATKPGTTTITFTYSSASEKVYVITYKI